MRRADRRQRRHAGARRVLQAKYGSLDPIARGQAIYNDLCVETFKGIAIHEMGHSLGMLHQFASSWDAPNYNPQYWQLRTNEGKATASCNGQAAHGRRPTPAWVRATSTRRPTTSRASPASRAPASSTSRTPRVMEYQIERFGETVGLGTYDQHVMNALYGRVLEIDRRRPARRRLAVPDQRTSRRASRRSSPSRIACSASTRPFGQRAPGRPTTPSSRAR